MPNEVLPRPVRDQQQHGDIRVKNRMRVITGEVATSALPLHALAGRSIPPYSPGPHSIWIEASELGQLSLIFPRPVDVETDVKTIDLAFIGELNVDNVISIERSRDDIIEHVLANLNVELACVESFTNISRGNSEVAPRHSLVVGLNGRFSGTLKPTGTQVTSFHLFDAIIRGERDFEVVIFADEEFPGVAAWRTMPHTRFVDVPFSRWRRFIAQMWEQIVLPIHARKAGCTVLHHPMTTCPLWRNGIKQIVTVHDLNFFHHPEWVGHAIRCWFSAVAVPAIKQADHVATISDYVLDDVRHTLGIAGEKSSRIYNGLTPLPDGPADPARDRTVRVILGVNLWQPHKNLARLIGAISRLRSEMPDLELHLAGRPQANYRTQPELAAMLARPGVRVLGYLSEQDLATAYASADVVCYPSLEEGFGLPILEAMAAGAPVVASNASCLPEIAGGAAILVDPRSEDAIANGIKQALEEQGEARLNRILQGKDVAARFPWTESAKHYIQLYKKLA